MSEEFATPELVERVRQAFEAGNSGDLDSALRFYDPDAVWDMSRFGMGTFEGRVAIRQFFEDWTGAYDEWTIVAAEIQDLGHGVSFATVEQRGRLLGSDAVVELRYAAVTTWAGGMMARVTNYSDTDEGRAAAEALAKSRE